MVEDTVSLETRAIVDPEDIKLFIDTKMKRLFGKHRWYSKHNDKLVTDQGFDKSKEGILHRKFRLKYQRECRCKVPKFLKPKDREEATIKAMAGFEEYLVERIKSAGYKMYSMSYIGDELKRRMRDAYFTPGYHEARKEADERGKAVRQQYEDIYNQAELIGTRMQCGLEGDYIKEFKDLEEMEV